VLQWKNYNQEVLSCPKEIEPDPWRLDPAQAGRLDFAPDIPGVVLPMLRFQEAGEQAAVHTEGFGPALSPQSVDGETGFLPGIGRAVGISENSRSPPLQVIRGSIKMP
jgi:hypothetical protein